MQAASRPLRSGYSRDPWRGGRRRARRQAKGVAAWWRSRRPRPWPVAVPNAAEDGTHGGRAFRKRRLERVIGGTDGRRGVRLSR
jgi:hypothetical protein